MENEIRKHISRIVTEVVSHKKSIWKRIGEIIVEMAIIVFAVSLAVYLEKQREYNHDQEEVKEFLIGLRDDLQNDIREMREDRIGYVEQGIFFKYLAKTKVLNKDSLRAKEWLIWNTVHLLVNSGRYEGFKASGKMNTIKDEALRTSILDLYQETLVALTSNTSGYVELKRRMQTLIYQYRLHEDEPEDNLAEVMRNPVIVNYCLRLRYTNESIRRYDNAIAAMTNIIALINKRYGPAEAAN